MSLILVNAYMIRRQGVARPSKLVLQVGVLVGARRAGRAG